MSLDFPPEGAHCAGHSESLATWVCGRCGTFMCADCERRTRPEARPMCPGCWELRARTVPAQLSGGTSLPTVGLVLGVLSLIPMCIAVQLGSLVVNLMALGKTREGEARRRRWQVVTGLALTGVGMLLSLGTFFFL
ncbi:hypothetical protein P2318_02770 [Myxococcaceae bacterium GXIMD 01537]